MLETRTWSFVCAVLLFMSACSSQAPQPTFITRPEINLKLDIRLEDSPKFPPIKAGHLKKSHQWRSLAQLEAEPAFTIHGFAEGNDVPDINQGHLSLLNMQKAWKKSKGNGVVVAVIDSGVNNSDSLTEVLLPGYDFVNEQAFQVDESGHGTAVATLIAGRGPFWGMAPEAKLLPLKVLDKYNQGSSHDLIRALLFAGDMLEGQPNPNKADVINLSLGTPTYSEALEETILRLRDAGIWVIAATGNESSSVAYPAKFPEVIGVGAAEVESSRWQLAPYSNRGEGLDVLAPVGGWTLTNTGLYAESGLLSFGLEAERFHGTSFAAAEASGLAALMIASFGHALSQEVFTFTLTDLNQVGWDEDSGFGLINPLAALTALELRPEKSKEDILIQILDPGSLQEMSRSYSGLSSNLALTPGSYHLRIWKDQDKNGLWSRSEPYYWTKDPLKLSSTSLKELTLTLSYLKE